MMKKWIAWMLVLAMALPLAACSNKENTEEKAPQQEAAETVDKDTISVAVSTEPTTLNIDETNLIYDLLVYQMLYSRLIRNTVDGYEMDLAESYEMVTETQWRFKLHEGVKFSDGSDLTAQDVADSLQLIHDSDALGAFGAWLDKVEIEDDYTFSIYTPEPSSRLLMDLASVCFIVPSELIAEDYNFNEGPVGSGPYVLENWTKGHSLEFVANEDYYLEQYVPQIKNLSYRIMPEGISRTISLQNGEVDYLYDVQSTDISTLDADEAIEVYSADASAPFYLAFNLLDPIMSDINIRKAVAMGINRENASIVATSGFSKPLYSGFSGVLLGSSDEKAYKYNPEEAKALVEASGYSEEELTLTVVTKEEPFRIALESVQADMKDIGITLKVEMVDNATYTSLPQTGNYDMVVGKNANVNLLAALQSSIQTGAAYGQSFVSDPFVDETIAEALFVVDDEARAKLIKEVVDYSDENLFVTGIYQMSNIRAFNGNLDGFKTDLSGYDRFECLFWK